MLGFKNNCGETAAGAAGLKEARGDIVITIDADLQNDPKDIPTMLEYLKEYDMVTGWRQETGGFLGQTNHLKDCQSNPEQAERGVDSGQRLHLPGLSKGMPSESQAL